MDYTIIIKLTEAQNAQMVAIATEAEKTVQQILEERAEEMIMGQIRQWISDRLKTQLGKMDSADVLVKLNAEVKS